MASLGCASISTTKPNNMGLKSDLTLSVDEDMIARASDWLDGLAREWGWPKRTSFKLRLSLDEMLTNIMMYGYPDSRASGDAPRVALQLHQDGRTIVLTIKDNGVAFDPTASPPRDLDTSVEDAEIGGHGLRLIRHYLEDIQYQRQNAWNHLTLIAHVDET